MSGRSAALGGEPGRDRRERSARGWLVKRLRAPGALLSFAAASVGLLALAGCAPVGPDYAQPAPILSTQYKEIKGFKLATPRDDEPKGPWWSVLSDPVLDGLENQVEISNQTVIGDEANYRQALALIAQARAALFPTVSLDPSAVQGGGAGMTPTSVFGASLNAGWTLDIWGKVRREIEAAQGLADVANANLANAKLASQSALALAYIQLRYADDAHQLLLHTIDIYKQTMDIVSNQYHAGAALSADLYTAQAMLMSVQAQDSSAAIGRAAAEHAIAVLIGKPPADVTIAPRSLAKRAPEVPVALPSALLERRPDIAGAERTMRAANAAIGVAIAGYFPDLTLQATPSATYSTAATVSAISATSSISHIAGMTYAWNLGVGLAQPLFNGGLTDAQVAAARAKYDAAVATYRQTVLTALASVEDSLSALRQLSITIKFLDGAVSASKRAEDVAFNQYRAGATPFLAVATAETQALQDEQQQLLARSSRLTAVVNLIVDLGGGWSVTSLDVPK